jgi:hypothetical protein
VIRALFLLKETDPYTVSISSVICIKTDGKLRFRAFFDVCYVENQLKMSIRRIYTARPE